MHFLYLRQVLRLGYTLLLLLAVNISQGQNAHIDNLLKNLPEKKDTAYLRQLQDLIPKFEHLSTEKQYAQRSLELAKALNSEAGQIRAILLLVDCAEEVDEHDEALDYYAQVLPLVQKSGNPKLEVKIHKERGYLLRQLGRSEPALQSLLAGMAVADQSGSPQLRAKMHFALGDFYRLQRTQDLAIKNLEKSLELYYQYNLEGSPCAMQFTLATTYKAFKEVEKQKKGIELLEKMLEQDCGKPLFPRAKILNNLGSAYVQINDFEQGEEKLHEALKIKRQLNKPNSLAYTLNELASLHFRQDDFRKALAYAEEAYPNIRGDVYLKQDVLENIYLANAGLENYKVAFDYGFRWYKLKDSVLNGEKANALAEMATQYEVAKKEQAIARKNFEIAQQENRYNRTLLIAMLLISVAAGLFLWTQFRWQRQKIESQKLQELDLMKSNFFTNITHEFRTPLTLILNTLSLRKKSQPDAEQLAFSQEEVNMLQRNATRLRTLIDQLLDLSKLEAGKMQLQVAENDLSFYLKTLVRSFESLADQKQIRLQFISRQNPLRGYFDPDKLEKILTNLLYNAIKFTENSGEVNVWLNPQEGGKAEIVVQDNGIGISQQEMPFIFDRFHQADNSTTRSFEGSGIGLALVQQMVKVHQGTLQVESTPQIGTTFTILIPLHKSAYEEQQIVRNPLIDFTPPEAQNASTALSNTPIESTKNGHQALVLLIEDHNDLRFMLRQQLQKNYQVMEAVNGRMGEEKALEHIPDLIICDVMMPEKNGYEVCQTLKKDQRTSHIPIILLTAKATQEEKLEGLEMGADSYLVKPFDPAELSIRVRNLIQQRQKLQRQLAQKVVYQPQQIEVVSREDAFIKEILSIVERELGNENFGVEELSRAVHMSRSQLYRKIKALTGDTPQILLRNFRLERAKQLLQQDAGNVSEIAGMVGFSNANYFNKCFKDQFGQTPGEILRAN